MIENETPQIVKFTLAEMSHEELAAPSAEVDPDSGRVLTAGELIAQVIGEQGGRMWISPDGVLSEDAKKHNSDITRNPDLSATEKGDQSKVAVRVLRPVDPADRRKIDPRHQEKHGHM